MERYVNESIDFVTVYIKEAHAEDEWKIGNNGEKIFQHKCVEDRIKAAKLLRDVFESFDGKLCVDLIDNNTCDAYEALPLRLYAVLNGKIVYVGDKGPFGFNLHELDLLLQKQLSK